MFAIFIPPAQLELCANMNHQGGSLFTRLHRQVLIEWLRIRKHVSNLLITHFCPLLYRTSLRVPQGFNLDVSRQSSGPLIIKELVCFIEILVESILDRS